VKLKTLRINPAAKIISALFSVLLWLHVATQGDYTKKASIPIRYIEPSSGYMLASTPPDEMQVNLKGSGKKLMLFNLIRFFSPEKSFIPANLAGLPKGRHRITLDKNSIVLPAESGITVENILYNSFFLVVIDNKVKRKVRVNVDSLPAYEIDKSAALSGAPVSRPRLVTVEGPENIISSINSIKISKLTRTSIALGDTVVRAQLSRNLRFVTVDPEEVDILFPVEPLLTKLFRDVPLKLRGFPRKRPFFDPDTLSVFIQGPESVVSKVRPEDITVSLSYDQYRKLVVKDDSLFVPTLSYPKGITNATMSPGVLRLATRPSGG